MALMPSRIEMADLSGATLEIEIVVTRGFKVRRAVALLLVRLAAKVLRCGLVVKA